MPTISSKWGGLSHPDVIPIGIFPFPAPLPYARIDYYLTQFLENAITQGLLALLEEDVIILARDKDIEVAQRAADNAAKQYEEISGRTVRCDMRRGLSNDL